MNDIQSELTDWYNRNVVAKWYRSASLIGGWLTGLIVFLPDLLQFVADHWEVIGGMALPTMTPEMKALVMALYLAFGAPALRAWRQQVMTQAALVQAAESGMVTSSPETAAVTIQVPGQEATTVSTEQRL